MKSFNILLFFCLLSFSALAQSSWGDYTLIAVQGKTTATLLDNDKKVYHTWNNLTGNTGYSSYLLKGGILLRTVSVSNSTFNAGGNSGRVQKVAWDGTILWDFTYSSSTYCLHHDICPMPNGNVLMIAYELKTAAEATAAGSSTSRVIWPEKIIEVKPEGVNSGTIVWEWHLWDHLVQNSSASKSNYYSSISDHPELMNINYKNTGSGDWMHANGLDYNEELDQITLSSHNFNEVYIIDHSTTTTEAAMHTGGNSGKGGDFLYRWGNPAAYSTTGSTIFNVIHSPRFIPAGYPKADYMLAFNNGGTSNKSTVEMFLPPVNGYNYTKVSGQAFSPATSNKTYTCSGRSNNMGSVQALPNGNLLICIAQSGLVYEIDSSGNTLWSYSASGVVPKAWRYSADILVEKEECSAVSNLQASNIGLNGAVASWTAPSGQTLWELRYGLAGTDKNYMLSSFIQNTPSKSITGLNPNTDYEFYVRAICGKGDTSDWSSPQQFHTLVCPQVSGLIIDGIGSLFATVSWTKGENQDSWQVRYKKAGDDTEPLYRQTNEPTLTLMNLQATTAYEVSVRTLCDTSQSKWASTIFTTKSEGNCEPVYSVVITGKETDTAKVTWSSIEVQDTWQFVYGVNISDPDLETPQITYTENFIIPDLKHSTTYNIYIRSVCSGNVYSDWLQQDFTTLPCDTVVNIDVTEITDISANLSWSSLPTNKSWEVVYVQKGQSIDDKIPESITGTSIELTGLQTNVTYDVYVRGICSDQSYSQWLKNTFTTHCGNAPGLKLKTITVTSAIIEWDSINGQNTWQIGYGSVDSSPEAMTLTMVSHKTELLISNLTSNFQYTVYIRAICSNGDTTAWGNPLTFETENCGPIYNLETKKLSETSYLVTWNALEDQTQWETKLTKNGTDVKTKLVTQRSDTVSISSGEESLYSISVRPKCGDAYGSWVNNLLLNISDVKNLKKQVTLSPNPAKDYIKINWGEVKGLVSISIFDMSGKMIFKKSINAIQGSFTELPLTGFSKGMYSICLQHADWAKYEKLIVQ